MFHFNPTPSIAENLAAIERLSSRLETRAPLARGWRGRLRRELEASAVAASTSMEGVPVTVAEVVRILAGDRPPGVSPSDAELVAGYRDAMEHAAARAGAADFSWNPELILALHGMAMRGARSASPGQFRPDPVWVVNSKTHEVVYGCPEAEVVPGLVARLCFEANTSVAPAPVLAALVHASVARIHPFCDGNGRVARIAATLAMRRGGYESPELVSLEEWWGRHTRLYYDALSGLGACWNDETDLTPFVEAHVAAQRAQIESSLGAEQVQRGIWTALENIAGADLGMPTRAADALFDAFFGRAVTNRYYRALGDVSTATAVNDLARLEASGLIQAVGAGRSRHYEGTLRLIARVASECRVGIAADMATPLDGQRSIILGELAERLRMRAPLDAA